MSVRARKIQCLILIMIATAIAHVSPTAFSQEHSDSRANQVLDEISKDLRIGISRLELREKIPKAVEVIQGLGIGRPDLLVENYDKEGNAINPNEGSILSFIEKVRQTRVYRFEGNILTSVTVSIRRPTGEGVFPEYVVKLTQQLLDDGQLQMALLDNNVRAPTVVHRGEATCLFVVWQEPDTVSVWVCKGPAPRHIVLEDLKTRPDYESFQKFAKQFGL